MSTTGQVQAQEVNKADAGLDSINGSISEIGDITNALAEKLARILLQPSEVPETAKDTLTEDTPLQNKIGELRCHAHNKVAALQRLLDQIQW